MGTRATTCGRLFSKAIEKADTHFYHKLIRRIVRAMRRLDGNIAWVSTILPGAIPPAFPDFRAGRPPAAGAIAKRASMAVPRFFRVFSSATES
jgi:hypothetical protein